MEEYVSGKKAQDILGIHQQTLYNWDKKKLIETINIKIIDFYICY